MKGLSEPVVTFRESLAIVLGQWLRAAYPDPETALRSLALLPNPEPGAREVRALVRGLFARSTKSWWRIARASPSAERDPLDFLLSAVLGAGVTDLPGVHAVLRSMRSFARVAAAELALEKPRKGYCAPASDVSEWRARSYDMKGVLSD